MIFLFDFVAIFNICQIDLKLYMDLTLAFNDYFFGDFMGWWKPTMMTYV